jgi:hypothetical protein
MWSAFSAHKVDSKYIQNFSQETGKDGNYYVQDRKIKQHLIFKNAGCGDVGWIHVAQQKLHGVDTVRDRALQISFPLIYSVSRASKLSPKLYITRIKYVSTHLPPPPSPQKKTLEVLSTEDNFYKFIQHYISNITCK